VARNALTTGPLVFFDRGKQIGVPTSALSFNGTTLEATLPNDSSPQLLEWLRYQASLGRIVPASDDALDPALKVEAALDGTYGNNIEFKIEEGSAAGQVKVTASVREVHEGLTVETIREDLGKAGLLQVASLGAPAPLTPTEGAIPREADGTWTLSGTFQANDATVLEPTHPGADFDVVDAKVTVSHLDGDKFTLTVEWTSTVDNLDPDALDTADLSDLDFLVDVGPPDNAPFKEPQLATVRLSGGRDQSDAVSASAVLMANQ